MEQSETEESEPQYQPFHRVLPGLLFLTSIFLLNFVSRVVFAPLLPVMEKDLGLSHAGSGSFFLFISVGYCLSTLCSGFVSSRLSHKKTIMFSTISAGIVLILTSLCESVHTIRAALFALGLSAGLYLPSGVALITRLVSPAYWGRAVGVHEFAPNTGFVLVPVLTALSLRWLAWAESLRILGVVLVCAGLLFGLNNEVKGAYGVKPKLAIYKDVMHRRDFWVMMLLFSFAICSTLGLYTMLPLYLVVDRGLDQVAANHLVSTSRISSLFMPLIAGWLGDRYGNRRVAATVLFIAGLLTVPIGFFSGWMLIVFVFMQPVIAVCFFPSGFAILAGIGGRKSGNVALTLCLPLAFFLGGGVIPLCIGMIGDYFSLGTGIICAGCCILAAGIFALFRLPEKKIPV